MDFSDQVAIITGSSAGIGEAAAIGMAEGGAKLVINYSKNAEAAEKVVAACKAAGGDAIAVKADVSDDADCKTLVEAAMDEWGRLDILVNNAGTTKFMNHDDLEGLNAEDFEQIYALNLIGPYQMIKHARPHLAKSDAPQWSIFLPSPVCAALAHQSPMSPPKVRSIQRHWRWRVLWGRKISASMRCARALSARIGFAMPLAMKCLNKLPKANATGTPMGRAGGPDDIKGPILFFASRASAHVTGQLLVVDAGMLLGMPFKIG